MLKMVIFSSGLVRDLPISAENEHFQGAADG